MQSCSIIALESKKNNKNRHSYFLVINKKMILLNTSNSMTKLLDYLLKRENTSTNRKSKGIVLKYVFSITSLPKDSASTKDTK